MSQSDQDQQLYAMRHSLAHIMATAIQELYPKAKFGIGPVVENGFYYDVDLPKTLGEDDLAKIEAKMKDVIKANYKFEHSEMKLDEAIKYFGDKEQTYKLDLLNDLKQHGTTVAKDIDRTTFEAGGDAKVSEVGIYTDGPFTDLCRGPHVESTGKVGAFKLMRVSGAYWRGNEKNAQLQRVYGVGFTTKEELKNHLEMLAEAEKRDHRKLGREMDLFVFSDLVGQGLPLFTPRGTLIRETLNNYVQELRQTVGGGYQAVTVPHITKKELYEKSGHWKKFSDELFKIETREGHLFAMKPMNCPHHTQIYASQPRSYRELPIRYRETTMVYRDEQSGELGGLSRVRAITQDDAHVFCRDSQIETEIGKIWDIVQTFYATFGIELKVRFSRHDPEKMDNYIGDEKMWQRAEKQVKSVIEAKGVEYMDGLGESAFYGPKIDFMGRDVFGREFQAATIQLDFGQPEGFDLTCTNEAGVAERIVMVHAAIMGSLERFMVLLIEQTAGAFPTWLAPEQVRLAPINETAEMLDYTNSLKEVLELAGLRAGVDSAAESVGKKIRAAGLAKVPYTLVIGEKERESGKITPRLRTGHGSDEPKAMNIKAFAAAVQTEVAERAGEELTVMAKPILAVDVDEVLFPCFGELARYHHGPKGTPWSLDDFKSFEIDRALGVSLEEANSVIETFLDLDARHIEPLQDAREALDNLKQEYQLVIVTSRDAVHQVATINWLDHYFPKTFDDVILAGNHYIGNDYRTKPQVCREIGACALIDDNLSYASETARVGIPAVLFGDYPWNQCAELPPRVLRADRWLEVGDKVHQLLLGVSGHVR